MNREVLEQEIEKEKVKYTVRAFIKKAFIVTLSLITSATAFVGCKTTENPPNNSSGNEIVDSSSSENEIVDDKENSVEPIVPIEPVVEEIPTERIEQFLEDLSLGNYTYEAQTEEGTTSYLIDEDMMFTKVANESGIYYSYENAKMYKLVYDQDSESYFKYNEDELMSFDSVIYDTLVSTDWKSFDKNTDVVTGISGTLEYSLNLTEKTLSGDVVGRVYDINSTNVLKPTYVVDKTVEEPVVEPDDPVITDPVVTETENIYEVVDGEYVFDVVAIREVLLNWMQGDNQYGKDFLAAKSYADFTTEDIIYINADTSEIELGFVYVDVSGSKYYQSATLDNSELYSKILSGEIKTKPQFHEFLNGIKKAEFSSNLETIVIDTTISEENFDVLTERVFARMENKGVQANSVNNDLPETKLENFSNAEILYGFKTITKGGNAAYDLGFKKNWNQYYLIKYKGNIELVSMLVVSAINDTSNELKNVLENNEGKWMISSIKREDCHSGNEEIYKANTMVATSVSTTNEEKERELS